MLHIYRRHLRTCPHSSMLHRRCRCPIWAHGKVNGIPVRKSLETLNWDAATRMAREWEETGIEAGALKVEDALEKFISDCEARALGDAQLGKYNLMKEELEAEFRGRKLDSVTAEELAEIRENWTVGATTARSRLGRWKRFFKFCKEERQWIRDNPAALLKPPKEKMRQVLPFSDEEMEKIMWATDVYPDRPRGRRSQVQRFVLLLRYTGFRIGDAVRFESKDIVDGKIVKITGKTGSRVLIPVPEGVIGEIKPIPGEHFPFWSGQGNLKSAIADWQRTLKRLFEIAGVKGHAHMFRHTFAKNLLVHGVSLENVARSLGNTARIVEKHYGAWVQSRQDALEAEYARAFTAPQ